MSNLAVSERGVEPGTAALSVRIHWSADRLCFPLLPEGQIPRGAQYLEDSDEGPQPPQPPRTAAPPPSQPGQPGPHGEIECLFLKLERFKS